MKIVLASASPRRKELLELAGFHPEVIPSCADEMTDEKDPEKLVSFLSKKKAESVAHHAEDGIVVGSDTVVHTEGQILGKPADEEDAAHMLRTLSGKAHYVSTGVTLIRVRNGEFTAEETFCETTKVYVDALTEKEIEEYIATGEADDKAGAYGIQGAFGKHISRIEGDYYTVVGLPLAKTYRAIRRMEDEMP